MDVEVFSKTTRVVVFDSLGVSKALEQGRRFKDLLGDEIGGGFVDRGQVLHHQLGALGLAGAALARNDHHLALRVLAHSAVGARAHRKQMPAINKPTIKTAQRDFFFREYDCKGVYCSAVVLER